MIGLSTALVCTAALELESGSAIIRARNTLSGTTLPDARIDSLPNKIPLVGG